MVTKQKSNDPFPYDGSIERIDGVRPYNHYLWDTESWWANRDLDYRIDSRWHFGIVVLADGRFSVQGCVFSIERNEYAGKPCVFAARTAAIRTAAARMIRSARHSKNWVGVLYGGLKGSRLADVINWARNVVAQASGKPEPRPVQVKEPPPIFRGSGLPLFDSCQVKI